MKKLTIIKAQVRRAPVTGIRKKDRPLRKAKGLVYFPREWVGRKVIIIPIVQFRGRIREIRKEYLRLSSRLLRAVIK